jgi:hypothetical protein
MIGMKTISKFILAILATVSFMTVACDDMNSIIQDDLDKGEAIYPGRPGYSRPVDDVFPGLGKVWVYWALPSDSRVVKTIITYTFNGETKTVEKVASAADDENFGYRADSILIPDLAEGYYSFSMSTVDKEGHRSITSALYPQVVRVYGEIYLNTLLPRGVESTEMLAGGNLKITWANDTTDVLYSLIEHTDYTGRSSIGTKKVDTVFNKTTESILSGFTKFQIFKVTSYRQLGIDTAPVEYLHASPVVEKALLANNGFTVLTAEAANNVRELAYPIGVASRTLQDLYYFSNLQTLDLTPGTTELPELTYNKYYVDRYYQSERTDTIKYESKIGGCPWLHIVSGYMPKSDMDIIDSLLTSGPLTTVKYTRNSYPGLDAVLDKHHDKIVWNPAEPLTRDDVMVPLSLLVDYGVVDRDLGVNLVSGLARGNVNYVHTVDGSNVPAAIAEKFDGDLRNVYKVTIGERTNIDGGSSERSATTIAFAVPTGELQLGLGRLKFDCYIESSGGYDWLTSGGVSMFGVWKKVKVWCSRTLPGDIDADNSPYRANDFPTSINGVENPYRADSHEFFLSTNNPGFDIAFGDWTSCEYNLTAQSPGHYRVIRIQFGADGAPRVNGRNLVYYIANLRFEN